MIFSHWTAVPFDAIEPRRYEQVVMWKPQGFWFDVDGDWGRWCGSQGYRFDRLSHRREVWIDDPSRVLFVSNARELDAFGEGYRSRMGYPDEGVWNIDWPRVAAGWAGIVISPYLWERRNAVGSEWYYPWDCASGCVWDLSVIRLGEALSAEVAVAEDPWDDVEEAVG